MNEVGIAECPLNLFCIKLFGDSTIRNKKKLTMTWGGGGKVSLTSFVRGIHFLFVLEKENTKKKTKQSTIL